MVSASGYPVAAQGFCVYSVVADLITLFINRQALNILLANE